MSIVTVVGTLLFGIVIGWVTYRSLRREPSPGVGDIAAVIGALGGAAITQWWQPGTDLFGWYCIGLFAGFFGYVRIAPNLPDWAFRNRSNTQFTP